MKRRQDRAPLEWTADRLYAYGLRLLTFRPRTEKELRERFRPRASSIEAIDEAVERLSAAGLVDDQRFAQAWVESRRRSSPRGDRLLRWELAAKGVARREVEAALAEPADPFELAVDAGRKKARLLAGEDGAVFSRRLHDFLTRRGFDYEVVARAVVTLREEVGVPDGESAI